MSEARIEQIALVFVGFVVVGTVAFFGTFQNHSSQAATPGTIYVSPASGTYKAGDMIAIAIREDSGETDVKVVQAALKYNLMELQYAGITEGTTFPLVASTDTDTPGQIRLARAVNLGSPAVRGDNLVTTVNFRVLAGGGTTQVSFDTNLSLIVRTGDSADILVSSIGGKYHVKPVSANLNR